jgi:HEAT repeat protein/beta-lactamase regulating signal transducer with metallopeptidase domain
MTPADLDAAAAVVLSWLLTYAIHSTILLAIAAVAAWRFADQHAWLDVIWKAALIAPLVTATLQLDAIAQPIGGRWSMPSVTSVTGSPTFATARSEKPVAARAPIGETATAAVSPVERVPAAAVVDPPTESDRAVAEGEARSTWWPAMMRYGLSIAAVSWLIIAIVAVVRYGVRLRRVYRALRSGGPVAATDLLETIDELRRSANQRGPIRVTASALCPVPLALGGRHIVLPDRFFEELDPEQQRAALAHELAHVARRDPEWRIAVEILERALFFQPLNRLARARLCDSAEFLCDEWAVQQTQSPLALARCLSVVASWWSPADELPAGVSAMARSDSAMVRRVTRILSEPARVALGPRWLWLAVPVMLVAIAAPRVTATQLPASAVTSSVAAVLGAANAEKAEEQRESLRESSPAEIAAARAQLRVIRSPRPTASLEERWRDALADAARQRLNDFWIVYTFSTPTHADDHVISDSSDGSMVFSNGRLAIAGPPLTDLMNSPAVPLEGGNLAVLLHYRGTRADAIDRAGYRSVQLGFNFGRTPVFFLGDAPEAQSFERTQTLFGQARTEKIQILLLELASMHSNTNVVAPFLARLVEPSWSPAIRREAAEGFEHHHDPRSVEILLKVARTDSDASVRSEAAEAIGEVQTPQSIPALTDLVTQSADPEVRREAAEAFASQPAARALPAIEHVLATSEDDDVLGEAVEAIGELGDPAALALLVQTANTHSRRHAQQEAVETIGEIDAPGVVEALTRLAWEHQDVAIQREAVETLGDLHENAAAVTALERIAREHDREEVQAEAIETLADLSEQSLHPLILELAATGRSPRIRREALDSIGEAVEKISDAQQLDRVQQVIERAIFEDPDRAVQVEALDALENLPDERARRVLRDVIARHPDARVRREAGEHIRERQ